MAEKLKSAIFGGSFNPVHLGHIQLAKEVLKIGYSRIIFVPAFMPPHKQGIIQVSAEQRLQMLKAAAARYEWALVWDGEIRRGGISFSIDTVKCLQREKIIDKKPGFIIGEDWISNFHTWKDSEILADMCDIIIARRNTPKITTANEELFWVSIKLNNDIWPYSSTQVRDIIASGDDFHKMVPEEVASYIMENGIYGYGK